MELLGRIDSTSATPKYVQVANAIIADIEDGILKRGQRLPSINEASEMYYLSRDTIEKAYKELRKRGFVSSSKGKGCYITNSSTSDEIRVLLLFNKLSAYKKTIYYSILRTLGEDAIVDLHIHHFNGKMFENLIRKNLTKYDYFVVMPHFYEHADIAVRMIEKIPEDKLVLLDKNLVDYKGNCAAVYQDFEHDIFTALQSGEDLLRKYNKLTLIYPKDILYPIEIVKGFRYFCRQNAIEHNVISCLRDENCLKGKAYVVLEESDLTSLIKQSRAEGLTLGHDFGIVSYNETSLKEVLSDGITVISTDHEKMGETVALMMKHKSKEKVRNPFTLIRRNSL